MEDSLYNFIKNEVLTRPNFLSNELTANEKRFNYRNDYTNIMRFIEEFLNGNPTNRFLVLPGLRGVGKSTLLLQIYECLLKEKGISSSNIIYLSCENLKTMFNCSLMDAVEAFLEQFHNTNIRNLDEPVFLLIDESQYDKNWSMTGKIIFDNSKKIFMIFTGSSALELEYNADSARRLLKIPITPLNYSEHLKLKYNHSIKNISKSIVNLIFNGEIEQAMKLEEKISKSYSSIENYSMNEWNDFLKYGGFPSTFNQENYISAKKLLDIINRVITVDMKNIKEIKADTELNIFRLLYFFALQKPGEISQNSMASYLGCSVNTVSSLLKTLEKTHMIFHVEPYSSSPQRGTKTFKYYFATPSLRHSLSINLGIASNDPKAYKGILLENLVASSFFNLKTKSNVMYNTYFDSRKKRNVDFLVQRGFDKPIPIEVGIGRKDKKQIKSAISKYGSPYGIVISASTQKIKGEENIVFLPYETFSFM